MRVLNLIATDFSMSADFEQAAVYFEKFLSETPDSQLHNKAYYLYNYAVNLTKLNRCEKALQVINDAEKHIKPSNEFLKEKYRLLKVICYLFYQRCASVKKDDSDGFFRLAAGTTYLFPICKYDLLHH